jgi:hypothetical protein
MPTVLRGWLNMHNVLDFLSCGCIVDWLLPPFNTRSFGLFGFLNFDIYILLCCLTFLRKLPLTSGLETAKKRTGMLAAPEEDILCTKVLAFNYEILPVLCTYKMAGHCNFDGSHPYFRGEISPESAYICPLLLLLTAVLYAGT